MARTTKAIILDNINIENIRKYVGKYKGYTLTKVKYPRGKVYDMNDIIEYNVHVATTISALKGLERKGNPRAYELLTGHVGVFDIEDLYQVCLVAMLECNKFGILFDMVGGINLDNDIVVGAIYGTISNYMYQQATKHYKHAFIELDGDIVRCNDVEGLATHADIASIIESDYMQSFMAKLTDIEKRFLLSRLDGNSTRTSADIIGVSYKQVRTIEKHVRTKWADFIG